MAVPSPLSPTIQLANRYEALHEELGELYACSCPICLSAKGKGNEARPYDEDIFERAARYIHKRKGFKASMLGDAPIHAAIQESYDILRPALQHLEPHTPETVRRALDNNAFIFSGFRTYHSLRELGLSLTDQEGQIRPYEDFREDVLKLHNKYNINYLETEYEHAVGSSLMADRWYEQQQGGDRYNLQYRTAGDNRVRPDHEALEGITLPKSDKFWDDYYPPNGWRCRCDVVEVSPSDYPLSDSTEASQRGSDTLRKSKQEVFRGNPGKDLVLFPDRHPYYGRKGIAHCSTAKHAAGDDEGDACGVLADIIKAREGKRKIELTPEQREHRKEIKLFAREKFAGLVVVNEVQVEITGTCIKELLNQPHEHYFAKNELIRDLPKLIREAKYLGAYEDEGKKEWVVQTHLFEVEIEGEKSWLIALEDKQGKIALHSISDSPQVTTKKK